MSCLTTLTASSMLEQIQQDREYNLLSMLVCGTDNKQNHILAHTCKEMFTSKLHQEMYEMCIEQFKLHGTKRLNADDLINDYQAKKYKNAVFEALIALDYYYITDKNCDYYIQRLQETWVNRMAQGCKNLDEYKNIEKLKAKYELRNEVTSISNNSEQLLADYYERWENPLRTYYQSIDEKIGSLQSGDLMILAGATGMGKTCMMLNLIKKMAKHNKKILLFSLEMSKAQLQNRIISAETGINISKLRNFTLTDEEQKRYGNYASSDTFRKMPIQICAEYNINVDRIRSLVMANSSDIVFIDYLGLIKGENKLGSYEKVSEISRQLKLLALESKKPFIVLHQLNRCSAERADKRPKLSDIRDSGKIEQDADFICFVYRPAYYNPTENNKKLEFIIAKSRHSQSGVMAQLEYDGNRQNITDPKGETKEEIKQCTINC